MPRRRAQPTGPPTSPVSCRLAAERSTSVHSEASRLGLSSQPHCGGWYEKQPSDGVAAPKQPDHHDHHSRRVNETQGQHHVRIISPRGVVVKTPSQLAPRACALLPPFDESRSAASSHQGTGHRRGAASRRITPAPRSEHRLRVLGGIERRRSRPIERRYVSAPVFFAASVQAWEGCCDSVSSALVAVNVPGQRGATRCQRILNCEWSSRMTMPWLGA
jgi:hypothetical protein